MAGSDERLSLIEQYLATKRRIRDIERKALSKLGSPRSEGPTCSFCGATAQDVPLLIQAATARICSECIEGINGMLKGKDAK
jgi:hypothetical protein